jgi:hypothetical protein
MALKGWLAAGGAPKLLPQPNEVEARVSSDQRDQFVAAEGPHSTVAAEAQGLIAGQVADGEHEAVSMPFYSSSDDTDDVATGRHIPTSVECG